MSLDDRTTTGSRGQVASRTLTENRARLEPGARLVGADLYCVMGIGICNTQLVRTPGGLVVVDTGSSSADGEAILKVAAGLGGERIIAVVYTHSHYTLGTGPILERYPGIPVIAHRLLHRNIERNLVGARRFMVRRGRMESARYLPADGPDADAVGSRIETPGRMSYARPTIELSGPEERIQIGGASFVFHTEYPFDTDDSLLIWLEDRRAIIHNHFSDNFPNIYPIQGGPYRDPLPWLAGIDRMRQYRPEHLLGTHGAPTSGEARCMERLTAVRDALQYVHDQTVRGMNRHLEPEALVASVQLPRTLAESADLRQTYGIVANHVRGVYAGLAGWFDGCAASIYAPTPQEEAECLIRDMGGAERALRCLSEAMERGEYRWAARLGRMLYRLDGENQRVRGLYAAALRYFGQHTTAWTIRNYYLSEARMVEGGFAPDEPERTIDPEMALLTDPKTFVRALGYRADPSAFPPAPVALSVDFTDCPYRALLILRNGVVECSDDVSGVDGEPGYSIRCARRTWIEAVDARRPFASIVDREGVECRPSAEELRRLLTAFD